MERAREWGGQKGLGRQGGGGERQNSCGKPFPLEFEAIGIRKGQAGGEPELALEVMGIGKGGQVHRKWGAGGRPELAPEPMGDGLGSGEDRDLGYAHDRY